VATEVDEIALPSCIFRRAISRGLDAGPRSAPDLEREGSVATEVDEIACMFSCGIFRGLDAARRAAPDLEGLSDVGLLSLSVATEVDEIALPSSSFRGGLSGVGLLSLAALDSGVETEPKGLARALSFRCVFLGKLGTAPGTDTELGGLEEGFSVLRGFLFWGLPVCSGLKACCQATQAGVEVDLLASTFAGEALQRLAGLKVDQSSADSRDVLIRDVPRAHFPPEDCRLARA